MKRFFLLVTGLLALFSRATGEPLPVGAPAPAVSGRSETGATVDLEELYQKHPYTLVYFYPKADTPGCTAQGCSLRDAYAELTKAGVAVVGVSTDDVAAQKEFKQKYDLPFTLIADTDKSVMRAFGQDEKRPVASRQAFLIHDGRIVYADHKGSTSQQAQDILRFLKQNK